MQRRRLLALAGITLAATRIAHANDALADRLREGGVVLLLRHALTEPGVGDPPGFRPGVCATQRQLSAPGRAQAQRIGVWFRARGLRPARVRSSAWCRCLDTAALAFADVDPWPALNSFFGDRSVEAAQSTAMRAALAGIATRRFEVWVTHQVNITAFTGEAVAMGEGWVVRAAPPAPGVPPGVHNLGRLSFDT
jgi:phosphohistidine phosphatase SixA